MKYMVCAVAAVTLLSACGGSGGGSGAGTPGSWSGLERQGMGLIADWENAPYTTNAQMPQTGTATYRGVAMYGAGEVLSSAEMQANFGNDSISGRLHNFQAQNGTPISGEVAIRNGVITGAEYSASLAGELSAAGERATVSGSAYGDFSGRQAEIVDGSIDARLDSSSGTEYIYGEMILKQ